MSRTDDLVGRSDRGGRPTSDIAGRLGEHILDVALAALGRHGIEGASMDSIARAARVSKRTIYARFPSRDALLAAVLEHAVGKRLTPIIKAPRTDDIARALTSMLSEMLEASVQPETIALERLMLWARDNDPALTRVIYEKSTSALIRLIVEVLETATRRKRLEAHDHEKVALVLLEAAVIGPRRRMILGVDPDVTAARRRAHVAVVVDLLIGGLIVSSTPGVQDPSPQPVKGNLL